MLENVLLSGLCMLAIYAESKVLPVFCLMLTLLTDIVVVAVAQPYRYGFVACTNGSERQFAKIELYRTEDDSGYENKVDFSGSQMFAQHFSKKGRAEINKLQGVLSKGEILSQAKLLLFNQNVRRIVNLATQFLVQALFLAAEEL